MHFGFWQRSRWMCIWKWWRNRVLVSTLSNLCEIYNVISYSSVVKYDFLCLMKKTSLCKQIWIDGKYTILSFQVLLKNVANPHIHASLFSVYHNLNKKRGIVFFCFFFRNQWWSLYEIKLTFYYFFFSFFSVFFSTFFCGFKWFFIYFFLPQIFPITPIYIIFVKIGFVIIGWLVTIGSLCLCNVISLRIILIYI